RDDLVDRLLERMSGRWTDELDATGDYVGAIESILGSDDEASATAGAWIRLLAWSLLTEPPDRSAAAQRRHATLHRLPSITPDASSGAAARTQAAALALVFGWRFFHPYIRAALHLEGDDFADLQDAVRTQLLRILAETTDAPTRPADSVATRDA